MGEVAGADALRGGEFPELGQLLGIRLLVDSVNGGLLAVLELAGDEFVGEEHEFLDELVGNVVLHPLEPHGAAGFVEPDFDFRKFQIEGSGGEAFFAQQGGEFPCGVDALGEEVAIFRRLLENGERLFVGEPRGAADDGLGEADGLDFSALQDLGEDGERHAVDLRLEAADAIAERLRQHRDDPVGQINAVPSRMRLAVEGGLGFHIVGDIGDMDADTPTVGNTLHIDGVVKVLRVIRVDGENKAVAQILALGGIGGIDFWGDALGLAQDIMGKFQWQPVLANDREHIDAQRTGRAEDFDEVSLGVHMARWPGVELRDHFVADLGQQRRGGRFDIEVLDESRIVCHDIEEVFRALECSDDGFVGAGEDADDLAFAAFLGSGKKARFLRLARDARHDAVAVHGGETILGPDVEVWLALLFIKHMRSAVGMHLEDAREKIGLLGNDVAVPADAGDVAGGLHFPQ